MLVEYAGTVIVVSHDRYFINKVADKMLVFDNGTAEFYPYGYAEYELFEREKEEKKEEKVLDNKSDIKPTASKKTFSTPLKDKGKKERRVKRLEELISKCESDIIELNKELEKPEVYSDYVKVTEIQDKLTKLQNEQDAYSEEWLILSEELDG